MSIKEKKLKIKNLKAFYMDDWDLTEEQKDQLDALATDILNVGIEQGKLESSSSREGYKLVPVEPCEKTLSAMWEALNGNAESMDCIERSYKAIMGACDD